jgi:DNA-binding NtrC family response regulator
MANILVIDDDPDFRDWAAAVLRQRGHDVVSTSSARFIIEPTQGIQRPSAFDVAIVDMIMPEVDGIEAIRALRTQCPSTKIIAMSGGGTFGDAEGYLLMAERFGAADRLVKPFTAQALGDAVERVMRAPS